MNKSFGHSFNGNQYVKVATPPTLAEEQKASEEVPSYSIVGITKNLYLNKSATKKGGSSGRPFSKQIDTPEENFPQVFKRFPLVSLLKKLDNFAVVWYDNGSKLKVEWGYPYKRRKLT